MSVNALLHEREQEPEFFAKKCRRCKQPETKCECEDDVRRDEYGYPADGWHMPHNTTYESGEPEPESDESSSNPSTTQE